MSKLILLFLPYMLFAIYNPYSGLNEAEKLNILTNYFLNDKLRDIVPKKPIKEKIADDGPINPIKYELYYNYIQRLRAIQQSRIDEQADIDEKYAGKVGFYNGKLKNLKRHYSKDKNLYPLLQDAFNKTFRVIYGKPKIKNLKFDKNINKVIGTIWIDDIYGYHEYKDKKIQIDVPLNLVDIFIDEYRTIKVRINFNYVDDMLGLKDATIVFQEKEFLGSFVDKTAKAINFKIKIDDDIFKLIKTGDNK